jgi:hypothetical protein
LEIELDKPIKGHVGVPKNRPNWFTSFLDGDFEADTWGPSIPKAQRSDKTRDILGLSHFGSNTSSGVARKLLATLTIPISTIPTSATPKRPTPLDGDGRRFRAAFGDLRKKPYSWGRTVDLEKLSGPRPHRGGRELVIENFRPTGPVKFTILGVTRLPRNDWEPVNDDKFYKSMIRQRNDANISRRLKALAS